MLVAAVLVPAHGSPSPAAASDRGGQALPAVSIDATRAPAQHGWPGVRFAVGGRVVRAARDGSVTVPVAETVTAAVRFTDRLARTVRLQRQLVGPRADGRAWTTVASRKGRPGGLATLTLPTARPGSARYRVLVASATGAPVTRSAPIRLVVEPAGAPESPDPAVAPAADLPAGPAGAWSLLDTGRPGAAFRWDPCRPVTYRVHAADAPPTFVQDVTNAVRELSAATGLTFTDLGETAYSGPGADGDQSAWPADTDLLVTVSDESADPALAGSVVGYASILRAAWSGTDARIERADVVLRDEYLVTAQDTTSPGGTVDELLLHELGHAVGLGHSPDSSQVMYPEVGQQPRPGYQEGDLSGLARVGSAGGCLT